MTNKIFTYRLWGNPKCPEGKKTTYRGFTRLFAERQPWQIYSGQRKQSWPLTTYMANDNLMLGSAGAGSSTLFIPDTLCTWWGPRRGKGPEKRRQYCQRCAAGLCLPTSRIIPATLFALQKTTAKTGTLHSYPGTWGADQPEKTTNLGKQVTHYVSPKHSIQGWQLQFHI